MVRITTFCYNENEPIPTLRKCIETLKVLENIQ